MTGEATIELLKEVARVAPKEMGAKVELLNPEGTHVCSMGTGPFLAVFLGLGSDSYDAPAIIAILDAMEKDGWIVQLDNHPSGVYRIMAWRERDPGNSCAISVERVNTNGATRAEAVARAFVEVFKDTAWRCSTAEWRRDGG